MNRRKRRRRAPVYRGNFRKNTDMQGKISTVVIIICLSIAAGYLTATYVLAPILGLDTSQLAIDLDKEKGSSTADSEAAKEQTTDLEPDGTEGLAESGYVLQYGSFSTKEAAQECIDDLEKSGIQADIIEKDGTYKVVSPLFDTEQDARSLMEQQKNTVDVFITKVP